MYCMAIIFLMYDSTSPGLNKDRAMQWLLSMSDLLLHILYFCVDTYERDVVIVFKMGAYIRGVLMLAAK